MPLDSNAPEVRNLPSEECLRLLRRSSVGRLAMRGTDAPEIRPVNFLWREGQLVIRTGDGGILAAARRAEHASFETDSIDALEHSGWSVIVTGVLSELPSDDAHRARLLHPNALEAHLLPPALAQDEARRLRPDPGLEGERLLVRRELRRLADLPAATARGEERRQRKREQGPCVFLIRPQRGFLGFYKPSPSLDGACYFCHQGPRYPDRP